MRRLATAVAALLALAGRPAVGQGLAPFSFSVAVGGLVYDGSANIAGIGWELHATLARPLSAMSRWRGRIEYAVHRLSTLGQSCTLGVPSACYPESPPNRLQSGAILAEYRLSRGRVRLYALGGIGLYHRSATRRHDALLAGGGELGLGIAFGHERRITLEARCKRLGGKNAGATMWPVSVGIQLF